MALFCCPHIRFRYSLCYIIDLGLRKYAKEGRAGRVPPLI